MQQLPKPFDKLAKISPNWAKQLAKDPKSIIMKDNKGRHQLEDYACCVVGEAYKFNDGYYYGNMYGENNCNVCTRIANEFDLCISDSQPYLYSIGTRKHKLPTIINEFVAHWNKKHT